MKSRLRILIVDDDEVFRLVLRKTLEKMGHDVTEAENGSGALALFEKHRIELVITDLLMPEKDGLETISQLRKRDPGVKIIAMSGGGGRVDGNVYLKMAQKLGASGTLHKPFSSEELAQAIAGIV